MFYVQKRRREVESYSTLAGNDHHSMSVLAWGLSNDGVAMFPSSNRRANAVSQNFLLALKLANCTGEL